MKKIRAAIVGYGNIGRYVLEALQAAPDFEVAGVIRRNPEDVPAELKPYTVADSITKLQDVDVAILATPTRKVEAYAKEILAMGINTVDSFDIHTGIGESSPCGIGHLRWMGSGKRLCRTCPVRGDGAERNYLYQLRSRYEYGPHGSREGDRGREGCVEHDHSLGYRCSPSDGLYRGERGL